jgi:hypothetical protein
MNDDKLKRLIKSLEETNSIIEKEKNHVSHLIDHESLDKLIIHREKLQKMLSDFWSEKVIKYNYSLG